MQNLVKYSDNKRAILFTSEVGAEILDYTDEALKLASVELLRMEDEGGTPLTQEQTAKISAYAKVRKHIRALLFSSANRELDHKIKE
jgi:hypothetical protein